MDFATRQYNHNHRLDPIVRSRLDNDWYKLAMRQLIQHLFQGVRVRWEMTNRTSDVRLAEIVDIVELREQLDYVKKLRYTTSEIIYLAGQRFYGVQGLFKPEFTATLADSELPDYEVSINKETGQFRFETEGEWEHGSDWELYSLTIMNELRNRALMKDMSRSDLDILYARAKVKLYAKLERLAQIPDLTITDFGTRRRHSYLWQDHCVRTAKEVLGDKFIGTSNVAIAMEQDLEPKGTNAHELPMVYAALAAKEGDEAIRQSQYQVLLDWMNLYNDHLTIALPDTFGTTQFLENAPLFVASFKGARPDSKEPIEAGEELIRFWQRNNCDPRQKLAIFADGMDVAIPGFKPNGTDIAKVADHFRGRLGTSFGWGTMLTNDFIGCPAGDPMSMKPISLVCKVHSANGQPAVKLSDNFEKARSPDPLELERYRRIFGSAGMANAPTLV